VSVSDGFRTFVLDQLARTTPGLRARSMFGGVGLYAGDLFFALMDDDVLYFKVDDNTRARFEELGMGPFRPRGDGGEVMYYTKSRPMCWKTPRRSHPGRSERSKSRDARARGSDRLGEPFIMSLELIL
jgi:TfoX/Sxy family transcriptional regulator of competence genes